MSRRGVLLFAAMALVWGVPYLFIRIAVADLHPTVVTAGRCVIGALVLLPFAVRQGGWAAVRLRWPVVGVYTVVEVALPWWLLTDAEQYMTSSLAGLLLAATPLIGTAIGLVLGLDDRLDVRRAAGLLLGLLGVAALLGLDAQATGWLPVVQVLLTATGYAVGSFMIARVLTGLPVLTLNTVVLTAAFVGYLPFALTHLPATAPSTASVVSVVVLGVVCTSLAFVLFFALIAEIGPTRATVITYVNPAVALAAGVLFLAEPVTVGMAIGFPLVLLGSYFATQRRAVSPRTPEASAGAPEPPAPSPAAGTGRRRGRATRGA